VPPHDLKRDAIRLTELNRPQREAVRYTGGPLLVLAGAGSGKTRVITHKIAHLIAKQGLAPAAIAAVTFTNKAAREMKGRVARLVGRTEARALQVSTFHALGLRMLRRDCHRLGRRAGFTLLDPQDCAALVAELMRGRRGSDSSLVDRTRDALSRLKSACHDSDRVLPAEADDALEQAVALQGAYDSALATYNAFDLDDLIALPVRLLAEHEDVRAHWRSSLRYLLVDEYQDSNMAQYELVRALAGERGALTVVGDDDQSIYGWRGAQPENLARLAQDYPGLRLIKLEQNFRSCGNILSAANGLIAQNPHVFEKALWSRRGPGEPLQLVSCADEEAEAAAVVGRILQQRMENRAKWSNFAVLYRGNHQSRAFERALREHNVPYTVSGGPSFFDLGEVKDVLAYLRLMANPDDDSAFLRIVNTPRREIGMTTVKRLVELAGSRSMALFSALFEPDLAAATGERAAARLTGFGRWLGGLIEQAEAGEPVAAMATLLDDCRYRDWLREGAPEPAAGDRRAGNVDDLLDWMRRLAREDPALGLSELVAAMVLADRMDGDEDGGERVRLMTLHAAKGLEFRHVFLVGMEENLLPHRACQDGDALAEERRLAYVGITRAQETLTFTHARQRKRFGAMVECVPSRFLAELPTELLDRTGPSADPAAVASRARSTLDGLRNMLKDPV